jgi:hypothetical protein
LDSLAGRPENSLGGEVKNEALGSFEGTAAEDATGVWNCGSGASFAGAEVASSEANGFVWAVAGVSNVVTRCSPPELRSDSNEAIVDRISSRTESAELVLMLDIVCFRETPGVFEPEQTRDTKKPGSVLVEHSPQSFGSMNSPGGFT